MVQGEEESPLHTAFGVVLAEWMEQEGITTADVHRRTGLARTSLYAWLRGRGDPSLSKLWTLSAALGLRPSELLKKVETQLDLQIVGKR
jgi:transcriptional regulator with XRE-family HTH domain